MKKFKFVCSLCVKVRRKAEKKKVKGKTKGRKSSSPGASDSEAIPGATPAARTAPPEDGNAQILASPSGTLGKNASTPNAVKPRSPKLKLKLKTSPPPASPPPPPPSLTVVRKDDGSDRMMGGVDEYGNESMTAFVDVGGADGEPAGSMPYVQVEPMPPPPSQPKKLKRRRLAGDAVGGPGSNGGKKNAGSGRGEEGGKARGGARRGGARAGGGGRGGRKLKRQRSSSAVPEGLDEDDSWGDESLEETNADAATRPSPYGTRDRSSRVKYVEEASDNEGERTGELLGRLLLCFPVFVACGWPMTSGCRCVGSAMRWIWSRDTRVDRWTTSMGEEKAKRESSIPVESPVCSPVDGRTKLRKRNLVQQNDLKFELSDPVAFAFYSSLQSSVVSSQ